MAFLSVQTQWRMTSIGMAGLQAVGLDYAGAKTGLEMAGIDATPALWAQLRAIELGAREEMNREP